MVRHRVFSGAEWEKKFGYCRAVRAGKHVFVGGTAPVNEGGGTAFPGDAYGQAMRCFDIIEAALKELGGGLEHVVRTRMYVTDISRAPEIGLAHKKRVGEHSPSATMVEVRGLIDPQMLVEIEVDAILD
jgi:isochorismate pyruvate lyase